MGASSSSHVAAPDWLMTEDLPSLRLLGKGLSGFVYETICQGKRCARKDFPVGSSKLGIFTEEVNRLLKLKHQFLVEYVGYTVGKSSCSLVLDYVEADLQSEMQSRIETNIEKFTSPVSIESAVMHLQSEGSFRDVPANSIPLRFDKQEAVDLISQLAASMKYLHDNEIAHGDLKPKNVLLNFSQSGKMIVKVADFGLVETKKQIKLVSKRTRHFEVLTWRAPELFEEYLGPPTDDPFTDSDTEQVKEGIIGSSADFLRSKLAMADVYSFGVTCSYIFGGQLFFPGLSLTQLRERKKRKFMPTLHPTCPDPLKKIIYSSLNSVPGRRPTFSTICAHKALRLQLPLLKNPYLRYAPTLRNESKPQATTPKMRSAFATIKEITNLWYRVRWNKHQCERVINRCCALFFELESLMVFDSISAADFLLRVLERNELFIAGYANESQALTNIVCRTTDAEAFKELHDELDAAMAKLGFLGMEDAPSGVELKADAELDKKEMLQGLFHMSKSAHKTGTNHAKNLAQVVLERAQDLDVERLLQDNPETWPSYLRIDKNELEIDPTKSIDSPEYGSFFYFVGGVWKGRWLNCDFAMWVLGLEDMIYDKRNLIQRAQLQHPHIAQLVGIGQSMDSVYVVMESMDIPLEKFMIAKCFEQKLAKPFIDREQLEVIIQIARGMNFIHSKRYALGGLEISDIWANENRGRFLEVKICAFEMFQDREGWDPRMLESRLFYKRWAFDHALSWDSLKGMDIFGFGMICHEIVTGNHPFHELKIQYFSDISVIFKAGMRPKLPEALNEDLKGLIQSCWDADPLKRPNFEIICQCLDKIR